MSWSIMLITSLLVGEFTALAYVEPDWWPLIQSSFDGINLRRCYKRNGAIKASVPPNGEACSSNPKTCFFDDQMCNGTPYPQTRCFCDGTEWQCESVACPEVLVDSPECTGNEETFLLQGGVIEGEGICDTNETKVCVDGVFVTTDVTIIACVSANPPSIECTGDEEIFVVTEGLTNILPGAICTTNETKFCVDGVFNTTETTIAIECVDYNPPTIDGNPPLVLECSGNQENSIVTDGVTDFVPGAICTITETQVCVDGVFNTTETTVACVDDNPPSIECQGSEEIFVVTEGLTNFLPGAICSTNETKVCVDGVFNTTETTVACVDDNPPTIDGNI